MYSGGPWELADSFYLPRTEMRCKGFCNLSSLNLLLLRDVLLEPTCHWTMELSELFLVTNFAVWIRKSCALGLTLSACIQVKSLERIKWCYVHQNFSYCISSFGGLRSDWQKHAHKWHRWSMISLAWGASPNFDLKPTPLFKRLSKCPQTRMERRWEQSVFWHMECVLKSICSPSIVISCFVSPGQWFCWWRR